MTKFSETNVELLVLRDEIGETIITRDFIGEMVDALDTAEGDINYLQDKVAEVPSKIATLTGITMTTTEGDPVVGVYSLSNGNFTYEFPAGTDISSANLTSYTLGDPDSIIVYKPNAYTAGDVVLTGVNWNLILPIEFWVYAKDRAFFAKYTITTTVAQA